MLGFDSEVPSSVFIRSRESQFQRHPTPTDAALTPSQLVGDKDSHVDSRQYDREKPSIPIFIPLLRIVNTGGGTRTRTSLETRF